LKLLHFGIFYLIYTLTLAGIAYVLQNQFSDLRILASNFWMMFGFLAGITFIAYAVADLGIKRNPGSGIMAIMGSIALKMIFSMAFVLIYSLNSNEKGKVFVLNFFSLYLLFSFFEIYCLLRNLRHQNK